jgi:signal transduction histidine kinase
VQSDHPAETTIPARRDERASDPSQEAETRPAYLAYVAHEMRNPLATALWSAELLVRLAPTDRSGPRGEKLAGMCLRTLGRLRQLMEDHFLVDRLAIGGIPLKREPVALSEALDLASKKSGVPVVERDLSIATASVDKATLERALEALLVSAGRDDARVRVSSTARGGSVVLRITGAPPPDDALRAPDRTTPPDPTGRALGLLMTQAVARAHGGTLELDGDSYVLDLPGAAEAVQ